MGMVKEEYLNNNEDVFINRVAIIRGANRRVSIIEKIKEEDRNARLREENKSQQNYTKVS